MRHWMLALLAVCGVAILADTAEARTRRRDRRANYSSSGYYSGRTMPYAATMPYADSPTGRYVVESSSTTKPDSKTTKPDSTATRPESTTTQSPSTVVRTSGYYSPDGRSYPPGTRIYYPDGSYEVMGGTYSGYSNTSTTTQRRGLFGRMRNR